MDINKHLLVPKHSKLSDAEVKRLFESYSVTAKELPKINKSDPALQKLAVKGGDVIKIERESQTAGKAIYYRAVVE